MNFFNLFKPQGINPFQIAGDLLQTEQEKRRKQEEERKKQEELKKMVQENANKFIVQPVKNIKDKYKEIVYDVGSKRFQGNETIGESVKSMLGVPFGIQDPIRQAKGAIDTARNLLYGEPETYKTNYAITQKASEIKQKYKMPWFADQITNTPKARKSFQQFTDNLGVTPKEKKILDMASEIKRSTLFMAGINASVPMRVGKLIMDAPMARSILDVKKGAVEADISSAYRDIIKKEYPKTVQDLANKSKTTAAKIVTNARDFLINEYRQTVAKTPKLQLEGGKPVVREPILKTQPELFKPTEIKPKENYLYHTTSLGNIKNITTKGLLPFQGQYGKAVYFAPTIEQTGGYGSAEGALIRVKKSLLPKGLNEFPEQSFVNENIPPKNLEVSIDNGKTWEPIVKTKPIKPELFKPTEVKLVPTTPKGGVGEVIKKAPPEAKVTIKSLTKENAEENFSRYVDESKTQEEYVERVSSLANQVKTSSPEQLKQLRIWANRQIRNMVGSSGNYKQDFVVLQQLKDDPTMGDQIGALEDVIINIDEQIGKPITKQEEAFTSTIDKNLVSLDNEMFLPRSMYRLSGTQNKEWVRTNIPLVRMGNKRGMIGYLFNVLGIRKRDIGSLTPKDVTHLDNITNVEDVFGGSGLLTSLSKKLFAKAKFTYNELDPDVINSIKRSIEKPQEVLNYVKSIKAYYLRNPESDWLSDFTYTHPELKSNKDFLAAANLIDKVAGRIKDEITIDKFRALETAIPNFAETFKDVKITTEDALKRLEYYAKNGTSKDFVWIDPPYLWSGGYGQGTSLEKAEGFKKILSMVEALNNRGVKFIFTNNEPSSRVHKAGVEGVFLDELEGRIAKLPKEGMEVVRNISPISAQGGRREIVVSNLNFGEKFKTLRSIESVKREITSILSGEGRDAPRVFHAEATPKTMERVAKKEALEVEREKRAVTKNELRRLRALAKSIGERIGPGATSNQLATEVARLIGKATTEGIDVAIGKEYKGSVVKNTRALLIDSIRDYIGKQGEPGQDLSKALLYARRRGDSYAGNAIADIEPALKALSEEDIKKFVSVIEDGLKPDTPALEKAVNLWKKVRDETFSKATKLGLDIKFRSNYFPHFVPEDIIKNARLRKDAFVKVVQMGKAQTVTEAESMYNQVVLRKVARRYGNLEKPRAVDFPIYERDPRKVIPTYLDSAWHRIADAEYLGANDEKAYGLADQIAVEGGDANAVRQMLDLTLGKSVRHEIWERIENVSGAIQVITKFTPMTTLANLTQKLEVLAWVGPKAWTPYALKSVFGEKVTPSEREWATRTGVLLDSSKKQFIRESGGPSDWVEKYLRLIRFSTEEDLNRIFTANVARDWAQNLFYNLQKNPTDKSARRALERIGIDVTKALTNGELSRQDLIDASQFISDHTQYPYRTEELPFAFKSHPLAKMLFRWKSYMYFSTKNKLELGKIAYEEAIHGNFGYIIGMLLAYGIGYQIVGEIMNDLYAFIGRRKRDEKGFSRLMANYMWIGTAFTDTIQATRFGTQGVYSLLTGPDFAMATKYILAISELAKDRKTKEGMGEVGARTAPLGKAVVRDIPVLGPTFKGLLFPPEESTTKGGGTASEILKSGGSGSNTASGIMKGGSGGGNTASELLKK